MTPSALPNKAEAAAHSLTQATSQEIRQLASTNIQVDKYPVVRPSPARLAASLSDAPLDLDSFLAQTTSHQETFLYLAYGSNLSNETFRGMRGIKPLSQINVQVPSLRLTFDLPGLPYKEPCFANTVLRDPNNDLPPKLSGSSVDEKELSLSPKTTGDKYRKNRWHKGLVGVVYEVTRQDYAHIIATEGGGSSYQDILVDCYPFETSDISRPVPINPSTQRFKAHTLFAPELLKGKFSDKGGRFRRPDRSYAQPSSRYKKLITDGAAELKLPSEYQEYLQSIHPYTITTLRQRAGQILFLSFWGPSFIAVLLLSRNAADDKGRVPKWLARIMSGIIEVAWANYDAFFCRAFGDGERTIGDDGSN